MTVIAILLAAGAGRRMGGRKLELPWGERTLIEATLAAFAGWPTLVVLGCEAERLVPLVRRAGATEVVNERWAEGMLASVQCGLDAAGAVDAALLCPADLPALAPTTVAAVAAAAGRETFTVPVHEGRRGHPVALGRELFAEVARLDPAVGLRQLRQRRPEVVLELPVNDPGCLLDLDTPEAYRRASQEHCKTRHGRIT